VVFLLVQRSVTGIDLSIKKLLQRMRFKVKIAMWYHISLCNLLNFYTFWLVIGLATKAILAQFIFAPFFIAGKSDV